MLERELEVATALAKTAGVEVVRIGAKVNKDDPVRQAVMRSVADEVAGLAMSPG